MPAAPTTELIEHERFLGELDEATPLHVIGWIADREDLSRPLRAEIFVNDEWRGTAEANQHRDGLAEAIGLPGATGNYCFRFQFRKPLPVTGRSTVAVKLAGDRDVLLGSAVVDPIGEGRWSGKASAPQIWTAEDPRFPGRIDEVTRLHISGWVMDRENLDRSLTVGILANGVGCGEVEASQFRPGFAEETGLAGASGRYFFRFDFPEPLSPFEQNEIVVRIADADDLVLAVALVNPVQWDRSAGSVRPQAPILVSSMGRSGSTLLMGILAAHPQIVVAGKRPFEIEMICYYVYALRAFISEGDHEHSLRPDRITAAENRYHLGFNPYFEPSFRTGFADPSLIDRFRNGPLAGRLSEAFRNLIVDFYEAVACDKEIDRPLFFAEKILPEKEARLGARYLFGNLKEIVLVRDLRDVLCSFMSSAGTAFETTVQDIGSMAEKLLEAKASIESDKNTLLLRYEDLVEDESLVERIFQFLGVYPVRVAPERRDEVFRGHGTSANAEVSIGRWRRDLTTEQLERCRVFDAFLEAFGYEPSTTQFVAGNRSIEANVEQAGDRVSPSDRETDAEDTSASEVPASAAADTGFDPPLDELIARFESLGENCEFGLVQRRCGAEPLGLFRFASAPLPRLIAALDARFDGFGARDNIAVEVSATGREYMIDDRRFGLLYHAWVLLGEMTPEAIHAREVRRLPLLVRKLIEDLTSGDKIFVCHGMDAGLDQAVVRQLLASMRRYGPGTLLWVERADEEHPPGTVELTEPGLLKAYIDRFAPGEDAHNLSFSCWIAICREAYRLWQEGRSSRPEAASPVPDLAPNDEPELAANELMMRFESLGEDAEFGLIQRRCGAEPLGLFRFADAPLPSLLSAFEADFAGFAAPENLAVGLSPNGREYMIGDTRFGLRYRTWVLADEMLPEEVHAQEARRLPRLLSKLLGELREGRKLLVIRGTDNPLDPAEVQSLSELLRKLGPNTLLWVDLADADNQAGQVERIGPGLLKGYVGRFAPNHDPQDLLLDCWMTVCRNAERLWRAERPEGAASRQPKSAAAAQ